MRLSRFFIDRPIFAVVIAILITLVGAISYFFLPVSQYPEVVPPTVTVNAVYPGASAETVADTVANPIEQEINGVDGMLYLSSQSTGDGKSSEAPASIRRALNRGVASRSKPLPQWQVTIPLLANQIGPAGRASIFAA